MRSIIKNTKTVQFNWVPGLAIEDMAADLVSLLNDGTIAQWSVDTDNQGYRIDILMPDGMVFELRRGDSLRFESGGPTKSREAADMPLKGHRILEEKKLFDKCPGHLYNTRNMSDLIALTSCYDAKVVIRDGKILVNGKTVDPGKWILATRKVVRPVERWETDETLCILFDADEISDEV
jgi:hypothetical protein|uniref:Uncharacterized protein n=1 Tax=Siphoviridae sp. ctHEr2 TaxID=2826229 RepID=A0A8S5NG59_9CAUD|nr:MAG TPA: hypothetical protein [Siphoviridae sp. ctHEr2]